MCNSVNSTLRTVSAWLHLSDKVTHLVGVLSDIEI